MFDIPESHVYIFADEKCEFFKVYISNNQPKTGDGERGATKGKRGGGAAGGCEGCHLERSYRDKALVREQEDFTVTP
jgi:hypothetical protein